MNVASTLIWIIFVFFLWKSKEFTQQFFNKQQYLLCLVDRLRHGKESAVGEDSEHDKVVEVLVHGNIDCHTAELNRKQH